MMIYAVADLHLPGGSDKTMDVFGKKWEGHFDRIRASWTEQVTEDDAVLLPGDLSWAMRLEDALEDLREIGRLPGKKIILRGNHDYWWGSVTRLREALPEGMFALQNDAMRLGECAFCGSRGWTHPSEEGAGDDEDRRIYDRELIRLEMSLEKGKKLGGRLIVMTHYPPLDEKHAHTPMSRLITAYAPSDVVYGHLHGAALKGAFNGVRDGIRYHCVSCDGTGFTVRPIGRSGDGSAGLSE